MLIGRRGVLVLIWAGIVVNALVVLLGLLTTFDDPSRTRVDNTLLLLGSSGLVNAWLIGRASLLKESPGVQVALGIFSLLSAVALGLTDFGSLRRVGWAIKAAGIGMLCLVTSDIVRRS
jgi:hypothetical protein